MGQGSVQFKDVRKDLQETSGRLKEAGFGWMLPGSRGGGDNSTRRYLNKSHPLGWRNEAKLKLELVQKSQGHILAMVQGCLVIPFCGLDIVLVCSHCGGLWSHSGFS